MIPDKPGVSELFWSFSKMSMQAFGGVLPLAERLIVTDRKWLTRKEFVEMLAVSQAMPGPNIINLAIMLGDKFQGWRGGFSAMMGCLTFPMILVSLLTLAFQSVADNPITKGALLGMGAVSIGLVVAMGIRLAASQGHYRIGWLALAGTIVAVGFGGLSLPQTILIFGIPAILIRLFQLRSQEKKIKPNDT
jgi:chromate transporter